MINLILEKYNIKAESILKITSKVYRIYSSSGQYIFKYHPSSSLEVVFSRLSMLNLDIYLIPIRSIRGKYIENKDNYYFSLTPYIEDEEHLNKDIRLHFYIKALGYLHHNSLYEVKVSDGFFEESLNYLENLILETKTTLTSRMERIEKEPYHKPSDWYFINVYDHLLKATLEASRRLDILEDMWKKAGTLRLSLTYQNFSYDHIIVKFGKIVSLDKMAIAPSIYDLKSLFEEAYKTKIDISSLFKEYLAIHPLENYEKEWLLIFLFIPDIKFYNDDIKDLESLFNAISYLSVVEEFAIKLNKMTQNQENN